MKKNTCVQTHWPCGTPKSTGNAFSEVRKSPFAGDKAEQAKATIQARAEAIKAPVGGHAVNGLKNLSKRGQKLLAPVRVGFCTPIEPPGSGIRRLAIQKASI
jgi:hypothetical protein